MPQWPGRLLVGGATVWIQFFSVVEPLKFKLSRYSGWVEGRVRSDPAVLRGEPVFGKTRLAISKVAAMLDRLKPGSDARVQLIAELREDYPYLLDDDIEFAPIYCRASPRRGRPRG